MMADEDKVVDKADPGILVLREFDEMVKSYEEARIIKAHDILQSILSIQSTLDPLSEDGIKLAGLLELESKKVQDIQIKFNITQDTISTALHFENDPTWIYGVTLFEVVTHYKILDDGSLLLRLQGSRENLPLFEQLAVIHEIDLYPQWVPFCNEGKLVTKIGHAELLAYFHVGLPFFSRDCAAKFYGVDCLFEEQTILLIGKSVDSWDDPPIEWKPTGWFHDRMIMKDFRALVKVESPTHAKVTIVISLDLKAPLPPFILNFILQKIAGAFVYLIQCKAEKTAKDPDTEHGRSIYNNKDFYAEWLLPKVRAYCDHMGWEQPVIPALRELGIPAQINHSKDDAYVTAIATGGNVIETRECTDSTTVEVAQALG